MKRLAVMLVAAALAAFPLDASAQKSGGTLVVARPTDAISLDPHKATTAPEVWVYGNIFETLVTLDEKMQVRPVLAERWERVNDRTMRFHLRKGVTFHDGTPFNAAAVKFTLDRVLDAKTPARGRSWLGPVTGATVVDDSTVDVLTASPFGPLLNHLTMVFVVGIVSPDAVKKLGDDFGRAPVGTGPFRFEDWKSNQSITIARHDRYWGQKASTPRSTRRTSRRAAPRPLTTGTRRWTSSWTRRGRASIPRAAPPPMARRSS